MSSKGQLVIPQNIREKMGIKENSIVAIELVEDFAIVKNIDFDLKNQFKKSLKDLKSGRIKRVA